MNKRSVLEIIIVLFQIALLSLSVASFALLIVYIDYYDDLSEFQAVLLFIILPLNPRRILIGIVFYSFYTVFCCCCCCCLQFGRKVGLKAWRYVSGSCDLLSIFWCIDGSIRIKLQFYLDIINIVFDCFLLTTTFSLACVIASKKKVGGNDLPIVFYFFQCLAFIVILVVKSLRFRYSLEASESDRNIFKNVDKSGLCAKVFYMHTTHIKVCPFGKTCSDIEPEHRVKYHRKTDAFKLPKLDETGESNIVVGYYQTSIDIAKRIIDSNFVPYSPEMTARHPGLNFSTNFEMADAKTNEKGAYIVAKINLGRVEMLDSNFYPILSRPFRDVYGSMYFPDPRGSNFDEFVIREARQILKYVVVLNCKTEPNSTQVRYTIPEQTA